jgi:cytochrome P450
MHCTPILKFFRSSSLHRSAVVIWVVYEMAVRREYLPALRKELSSILETDPNTGKPTLTYASLRNAELFDSFIREVLRMKGDTISVFRLTTKDAPLGGYVIPKGLPSIRSMETVSLTNSYRIFDYPHRFSFP